jgi:quercetin dioxygenase-like cupin family protein
MHYVNIKDLKGIDKPGRNWKMVSGPAVCDCKNMVMGIVTFPPGSNPGPHVHETEEEIIYVISGRGVSKVGDKDYILEPGVALFTEPGLPHGVINNGTEDMVLVSVFSPPLPV